MQNERLRLGSALAVLLISGCGSNPNDLEDPPSPPVTPPVAAIPAPPVSETPLAAPLSSPSALTKDELADGWIRLFDEQTLFGWRATSATNWRVEEDAIVVDSGDQGLLATTTQFADFVLRLEFRSDPETNSGIFLRSSLDPGDVATDCYELSISPDADAFPTGGLVQRKRAEGTGYREGWRSLEVTVANSEIRVVLDGDDVLRYQDSTTGPRRGHIALQHDHGRVEFRDIRLMPLGLERLFNGRDLSGWSAPADSATQFDVEAGGVLVVRGGPGQLETTERFDDFLLRLECNIQTVGINSGIFFRSIPGDNMMGYESQIHNGFVADDRAKPADHGTGGIFRRQEARYVVADDLQWFSKTLVADGPHMAAWVNGIQVSDWTDTRAPNPNPRRGLRLDAGTIIIQGHDPTTNLLFRNMEIGRLK